MKSCSKREFFIDNLLVRIHLIIEMISAKVLTSDPVAAFQIFGKASQGSLFDQKGSRTVN